MPDEHLDLDRFPLAITRSNEKQERFMSKQYLRWGSYLLRHATFLRAARYKLSYKSLHSNWPLRMKLAVVCRDNLHIRRVPQAGELKDSVLTTHTGLKISADSYCGKGMAELIEVNKGVHEPQEEYAFQEVLTFLAPGATMVEVGAYWGYYSLWFLHTVKEGRAFLVEPEPAHLEAGRRNFAINGTRADFTQASVGADSDLSLDPPQLCVDDFVKKKQLSHVAVLHSDIQGYELEMLRGARQLFSERRVDYVFISTHGIWLHLKCLDFLRQNRFSILASADKFESFSLDGLIVARRKEIISGCPAVRISRR